MGENLKNLLIFAAGAAVGVVCTWKYVEEKYKKIADEEIESVKEVFSERHKKLDEYEKDLNVKSEVVKLAHAKPEEEEKPNIVDYSSIVNNLGYKKETVDSSEVTGRVIHEDGPYVIEEENYGEFSDYDTLTLIYYADGFLADEEGNLVDDIDSVVGYTSLDIFDGTDESEVYVRNDISKCDYWVLRSMKYYKGDVIPDDDEE